ncbi:DUF4129 domain-containing protein [Mycobacterium sp. MYCO198283]|uniref:DUF4129 domain-containing protein n=1 Tax=Mycobacterium sp. MYCO198283 TaxID=2883505 RepID=UPI001E312CAA|nr:DUF4129 domain-containing protein [Mycobacterium sp. MYCO198283]MCG5432829.1 DUF4129 domain-containing protein [Mycobacterium sp. MYCO198283]
MVAGIDTPERRALTVLTLLLVAAIGLQGYLPERTRPAARADDSAAAPIVIVAILGLGLTVLGIAVVVRLRAGRAVAPAARALPTGVGGQRARPTWRFWLAVAVSVLVWLLVVALLNRLEFDGPDDGGSSGMRGGDPAGAPGAPRSPTEQPGERPDPLPLLALATMLMLFLVAAGSVASSRRRPSDAASPTPVTTPEASPASHSLARAAELGLAEITDLEREPRDAIIACYAAMERELARVPGAVPQEYDTPTEVLARAVQQRALRADSAATLVELFAEARFSPHVMTEEHRQVAVSVLGQVLDELHTGA